MFSYYGCVFDKANTSYTTRCILIIMTPFYIIVWIYAMKFKVQYWNGCKHGKVDKRKKKMLWFLKTVVFLVKRLKVVAKFCLN